MSAQSLRSFSSQKKSQKKVSQGLGNPNLLMAASQGPYMAIPQMMAEQSPSTLNSDLTDASSLEKVEVILPLRLAGLRDINMSDCDAKTAIDQISSEFRVRFDLQGLEPAPEDSIDFQPLIKVSGNQWDNARGAVDALVRHFQTQPADAMRWKSRTLVAPPMSMGQARFKIERQKNGHGRAVAVAEPGHRDPMARRLYAAKFRTVLLETLDSLRRVPNKMRMRVQFGSLRLRMWKLTGSATMDLESLEKLLSWTTSRSTNYFDPLLAWIHDFLSVRVHPFLTLLRIGGHDVQASLISKVHASKDYLEPLDIRLSALDEVKPKHHILLFIKGLIVMSQLQYVASVNKFLFMPFEVYRREQRQKAVELAISTPEKLIDWRIEILNRADEPNLPFGPTDLDANIRWAPPDQRSVIREDVPDFWLLPLFVQTHNIEAVNIKTSWVYRVSGTAYITNFSISRQWDDAGPKKPRFGTNVELYGEDWDLSMSETNVVTYGPRVWEEDLIDLYPEGNREDGPGQLLQCAETLQDFICSTSQTWQEHFW